MFSKKSLEDFASRLQATSQVQETPSVALNKLVVACQQAHKGFDMWPERIEALKALQNRLASLAASGTPTADAVSAMRAECEGLGVVVDVKNQSSSLTHLGHGALKEAFIEDLDFEATKAVEVRKQTRWLSNK